MAGDAEDRDPAPPPRERPLVAPTGRSRAATAAVAAIVSVLAMVPFLRVWQADLDLPFHHGSDRILHESVIDTTLDHGWYLRDPDLGAPRERDLSQFPFAEAFPIATVAVLGFVGFDDATVVMNLLFLASFPVIAAMAAYAFRRLGASAAPAAATGVLYAFLPYHLIRGEHHLFLSLYAGAAIAGLLVVEVLRGRRHFAAGDGSGWRRYATGSNAVNAALCLFIGLSSIYYGAFAGLLLVMACAIRSHVEWSLRPFASGSVAVLLVTTGVLPTVLPGLVDRIQGETPSEVTERFASQSEHFALRLTDLVVPVSAHVFGPFSDFSQRYREESPFRDAGEVPNSSNLGSVGTVGLVLLVVGGASALLRRSRPPAYEDDGVDRAAAVAFGLSFLVATIGGIGAIVAYLATPQIRAWSRMSVVIAFFCLLAVARYLDRAAAWWRGRGHRGPWLMWACAFLVLGGLADQVPPAFIPHYRFAADVARASDDIAARIDEYLPDGASVLQLPMVPFPDGRSGRMDDYEQLEPALSVDSLRWSAGAVNGTEEDWTATLRGRPPTDAVLAGAALGFDAVWLETYGYDDDGAAATAELTALLGPPVLQSPETGVLVFDLRPRRAELAAIAEAQAVGDEGLRRALEVARGA